MDTLTTIQEKAAANAFGKQAPVFDALYNDNAIIRYKRKRVRDLVNDLLYSSSAGSEKSILELNAGTGEDAIYFAGQGHAIHATDISIPMQDELARKVKSQNLENKVSHELCSFTKLDELENRGPYDLVFSNFAGLNCTAELDKVLHSFSALVKTGGHVCLVIMPRFCLWEFLLLFKGKFKTAFRRFFTGKKGARARIEGEEFRCWYYNPAYVRKHLKDSFKVVSIEGLCVVVPPSYIENFVEKHPRLFGFLEKRENKWKKSWFWKGIGDYYIITLKKKS